MTKYIILISTFVRHFNAFDMEIFFPVDRNIACILLIRKTQTGHFSTPGKLSERMELDISIYAHAQKQIFLSVEIYL